MEHVEQVRIPVGTVTLDGDLMVPPHARGIVLFAHGSGSSRHSPRNRFVAEVLRQAGLGTLLMDLLTPPEEAVDNFTSELRFNIPLLAQRLGVATEWLHRREDMSGFDLGYFGASTGAAAALIAAGDLPNLIRAVVSRGGRPDLAGDALARVRVPALLIVGGNDEQVIRMNRDACEQLGAETKLEIIPGATHLFEEHGALEEVAKLARAWFARYLGARRDTRVA